MNRAQLVTTALSILFFSQAHAEQSFDAFLHRQGFSSPSVRHVETRGDVNNDGVGDIVVIASDMEKAQIFILTPVAGGQFHLDSSSKPFKYTGNSNGDSWINEPEASSDGFSFSIVYRAYASLSSSVYSFRQIKGAWLLSSVSYAGKGRVKIYSLMQHK